MPPLQALQHLYSSVEVGYAPKRGRGFQTVAISPELAGTADQQALDSASLYAAGRERDAVGGRGARQEGPPPKEVFFQLPSGRYAIGRIVDTGVDSIGREGNYLAHHLILSRDDLLALGGDPFAVLDAVPLAAPDTDLTPGPRPPLPLPPPPPASPLEPPAGIAGELLAELARRAVDGDAKTALLVGDPAAARAVVRWLFAALAPEERLALTFSTHFYECHQLRRLFALAAVRSRGEAPAELQEYTVLPLDGAPPAAVEAKSAYAAWLADAVRTGNWQEIGALNAALDSVRRGQGLAGCAPPTGGLAGAALWERAGVPLAAALAGRPQIAAEMLRNMKKAKPLAQALLKVGSPSHLCGAGASPEDVDACLAALRARSGPIAWPRWAKQWQEDPLAEAVAQAGRPWWRKAIARLRRG